MIRSKQFWTFQPIDSYIPDHYKRRLLYILSLQFPNQFNWQLSTLFFNNFSFVESSIELFIFWKVFLVKIQLEIIMLQCPIHLHIQWIIPTTNYSLQGDSGHFLEVFQLYPLVSLLIQFQRLLGQRVVVNLWLLINTKLLSLSLLERNPGIPEHLEAIWEHSRAIRQINWILLIILVLAASVRFFWFHLDWLLFYCLRLWFQAYEIEINLQSVYLVRSPGASCINES